MSDSIAVKVDHLVKRYGDVVGLDDVSFEVPRGQSVGIIGQNGAGKTTLVEIMVNLRRADSGAVWIDGLNVADHPHLVSRIGVQLQEAALFPMVKVSRYLRLFSRLYGVVEPSPALLDQLGLMPHLDKRFSQLSGGLKQRTLIALALLNNPDILILDEPTTGLDPIAREELWDFIGGWLTPERTLLVTSHYMEEIERLCTRVIVLADHRVVADDELSALLASASPEGSATLHAAYRNLVTGRGR